jgi:pimeloyl-ACP methyl ester carboxylesterase
MCVPCPLALPCQVAGTLDSHAKDLADLLASLPASGNTVVVAHSFGGLILQK